ncbi:MAG: M23 family metallopeptidase, partial [Halobaculum sp.]
RLDRTAAVVRPAYVRDGPVDEDGYTWWEADFNSGLSGWITAANLEPQPLSATDPAFDIGQSVATTADLNVRDGPGTDSDVLDTAPTGSDGTVVNGFATADGYTWWKVEFDGSVSTGWVVETYLGDQESAAFDYPLSGPITSDWYDVRSYGYHSSLDIAADSGTPITAARAGSVSNVVTLDAGGKSVYVDHGDGYVTKYMHLSEYAVGEGDSVARGETVSYVGETGHATGPHLHFELERNGENQFVPGERGESVTEGAPIPETYTGL